MHEQTNKPIKYNSLTLTFFERHILFTKDLQKHTIAWSTLISVLEYATYGSPKELCDDCKYYIGIQWNKEIVTVKLSCQD